MTGPFHKGSARAKMWELLQKGVTYKRFQAVAERLGVNPQRLLRTLRKGFTAKYTWELQENGNRIRVGTCQRMKHPIQETPVQEQPEHDNAKD